MPKKRTSIKVRAGYRAAGRDDQHRRCRHCSRKFYENISDAAPNCKLLGITINPDYTCREYKQREN